MAWALLLAQPACGGTGEPSGVPTALDGVEVQWPEALHLCASGPAGGSLDEAQRLDVVVELSPSERSGLGRAALSDSGLLGELAAGPLSTDRRDLSDARSAVDAYELTGDELHASLHAVVEHDLGEAGALVETLDVERDASDPAPVVVGGGEVGFAYRDSSGAQVELVPCDEAASTGSPGAIEMLAATGSGTTLLLARHLDPDTGAWVATEAIATGTWPARATGRWANVRGDGGLRVDLTRDLVWYQTFVGSPGEGGGPITEDAEVIQSVDVLGTEPGGAVVLRTLDIATGEIREQMLTVVAPPARVDLAALGAEARALCDGGQALGWRGTIHTFALLTCPGDGPLGADVRAVVPLVVSDEPSMTARRITDVSAGSIDGVPAIEVAVGSHTFLLARRSDAELQIRVLDASGAVVFPPGFLLDGVYSDPLVYAAVPEAPDEAIEATGDGVWTRVVRRLIGQGSGHTGLYVPVSLEITFGDVDERVDLWDRMTYSNTHHNWADRLTAETDDLVVTWESEGGTGYAVSAERRSDGRPVLERTELTPIGEGRFHDVR